MTLTRQDFKSIARIIVLEERNEHGRVLDLLCASNGSFDELKFGKELVRLRELDYVGTDPAQDRA